MAAGNAGVRPALLDIAEAGAQDVAPVVVARAELALTLIEPLDGPQEVGVESAPPP